MVCVVKLMADYNANIAPFINQTFWVTSEFWEVRGSRHHHGIDLAVPMATSTTDVYEYSMCNGECIEAGYEADGYGNYIIIKSDDGTGFLYAHQRIPQMPRLVDRGDRVVIGQAVGYQGSTGSSTGPHLHLEMQYLGSRNFWIHSDDIEDYINPAEWMGFPNTEGISVFYNGTPINVEPPIFVELTITKTEPGVRGDTVKTGGKPATLETGFVIQVPLFVNEGDRVRVDTRTGEYMERL